MFTFFKKYDSDIYDEIINEVQPSLKIKLGYVAIASALEKILKPLCEEYYVFEKEKMSLGNLIYDEPVVDFLTEEIGVDDDTINQIKRLNTISNDRKHKKTSINSTKMFFKVLFDMCVYVYTYKFGTKPKAKWDEEFVEKLFEDKTDNEQLEFENLLLKEEREELGNLNKALKDELEKYKLPISRINLPEYTSTKFKEYKYTPKLELKSISENSKPNTTKQITNQIKLKKIGSEYSVDLSTEQSLDLVSDYINRSWFDEAVKELNKIDNICGDGNYILFIAKQGIKSIDDLDNATIIKNLEHIKNLIQESSRKVATKIINKLIDCFEKVGFTDKYKIFKILSSYDFVGRPQFLDLFEKCIKEFIGSDELNAEMVTDYLNSLKHNYIKKIKEFIELLLLNCRFDIANELNKLILSQNDKDIYALSKKLLIDCKVSNENELHYSLGNIEDLTQLNVLIDELAKSDTKLFRVYVDIISKYINESLTRTSDVDKVFELFNMIYVYNIANRDKLKDSVTNYLLDRLNNCNNVKVYDYLETILKWSNSGKEYVDLCQQIAVASLNSKIKDDRFIKILINISPDEFEIRKLQLFHNNGLSFSECKPFTDISQFNKIAFSKLIKLSSAEERKDTINQLVDSLIKNIYQTEDLEDNILLFNYLIKYFNKDETVDLFNVMKKYADELIKNNCFYNANDILRKMLSLNYRVYETCFMLMLCDYKVRTIDGIYESDNIVMDNKFYDLAIKSAFVEDKQVYEEYLKVYERQQARIKYRQQQNEIKAYRREQIKKETNKKILDKISGITVFLNLLVVSLFLIVLGIIFNGWSIGLTIMLSIFAFCFFVMAIGFGSMPISDGVKNHKKFITYSVVILTILVTIAIISLNAIYKATTRVKTSFSNGCYSVSIGCNAKIKSLTIPNTNMFDIVTEVRINTNSNDNIEEIIISYGIEKINRLDVDDCDSLTAIYIPASVSHITYSAFAGVKGYTIYFGGTEQQWKKAYYFHNLETFNRVVYNYNY